MKKIILSLFVLCILLATNSYAQSGFEIGAGLNPEFSGIMNNNDENAGHSLNYADHYTFRSFGFDGIYNFNKNIGISTGFLFSREGQRFSGNFNNGSVNAATYSSVVATQVFLNNTPITAGSYVALAELNYFKVPLMLSITSDNTKPFFFTMQVGPQVDFLQSIAQEVTHSDLDYPNTNVTPKGLYSPVTFSGALAVGGACNISHRIVLSAQLRFDYGFTDAEKKDVMISYAGAPPVDFYSSARDPAHSTTAGLMLQLNYKL